MNEELLPQIWIRRVLTVMAAVAVLVGGYYLLDVLTPFLLAWIAAYLASPLVDFLEQRWKGRREGAVVFVMLLVALLALLAVVITIPILIQESAKLARAIPDYRDKALAEVDYWQASGRIPLEVEQVARELLLRLQDSAPEIASFVGLWLFSWLSSLLGIFNVLLDFLLFAFVFYYFLRDFHIVNGRIIDALPERFHATMQDVLTEIDLNLRTVLRGQLIVAVCMGMLYTIGLSFIGVPYAVLIGPISGLGNFLPYIGPLLGMIPALLFTILHASGDLHAILVQSAWIVAVFGAVQVLESYFLTPKLAGESVGLGPVAVLFALSVGGALLGIFGVLIALPLAAIVKVLLERGWASYQDSSFYRGAS